MGRKGIDISEWQAGMDVERVCRENDISFVMVRSNYGSAHDDLQFHRHCDGAERGGAIVLPYVYPLASDTRGSIDDCVRIIGERYNRVAIDWEAGSGNGDHLRFAHDLAWERGLRTPLVYDPKWYYDQQGSPNVDWMGRSGKIAGRWKSWYPDNIADSFENILRKLPPYVWDDNRGGIPTLVVQFTSSAILSGWGGKLDGNWFRGTQQELEALLIGTVHTRGDNDMFLAGTGVAGGTIYAVGASGKRPIRVGREAEAFVQAGAPEVTLSQHELDQIPTIGETVWNYGIPPSLQGYPPLRTDGEFEPSHRVMAHISGASGIQLTPEQFAELKDAVTAGLAGLVPTAEQNAVATVAELKKEGN